MPAIHRRQFLTWGLAGTAAILSTRCSQGGRLGEWRLNQPPFTAYRSQSGLLNVTLQARRQQVTLANQTATLLAYNGQVPGPYLEAQAGDTVQITFENQLPQTTNLHFHGLHIPPTGNADNPFLAVPPGESQHYEFVIPADHPGGLFWYHPHHHGVVAEQVSGGLVGAFMVRGQVDEIPEIQAAQEAILVLQDFDLNRRGQLQEPVPMFRRWGRQGNLMTVNGALVPELQVPPSGLLRLRLLNASPSRIYRLQLDNHPWHLIGLDGGTLPEPTELDDLVLAPGERADILVAGNREPNTYRLVSLPYDRGIRGMMQGMGRRHHHRAGLDNGPRTLARLRYGKETTATVPLPKNLISADTAFLSLVRCNNSNL
jgi:FtsP/CotA-like multicopper oxidase with cupredoxin domain